MTARWKRSVGLQVIGSATFLLALIMLLSGWWNIDSQRSLLVREVDRRGKLLSHVAAISCRESMLTRDYPVLESFTDGLVGDAGEVVFAWIERADGTIVARRGSRKDAPAGLVATYTAKINSALHTRPGRAAAEEEDNVLGRVVLGLSTVPVEEAIAESRNLLVWQALLAFLGLAAVLLGVMKFLVHDPLKDLDQQAQRLGSGDLDHEIRLEKQDELGRLAGSLDRMRRGLRDSYREIQDQNQRLQQLDRLKSEFLANVSHEIRTPMNGILGFTELLTETRLDEVQSDMVAMVQDSATGLLSVINDILDFSKFEAGKLELEEIPCDVRQLLEDVAQLLSRQAHEKNVEILAVVDAKLPEQLYTDPVRLRQILLNLTGNAVKFTERGEVVLRAAVREQDDNSSVVAFEIVDTGIGIDPTVLPMLFAAFTQADGSTTRKYGGTGLGLAISKRLVGLMGAEISVESAMGKGSRFRFEVRLRKRQVVGDAPEHPKRGWADWRILVVDDNTTCREASAEILQSWGLQTVLAGTIKSALALLQDEANHLGIDAALLDTDMVEDSSTARAIQEACAERGARLILAVPVGSERPAHLPAAALLTKPLRAARLSEALELAITRTGAESAPAPRESLTVLPTEKPTILVVEDNQVNRKVAVQMLRRLGFDAEVANDGRQALEAVTREGCSYGLILMDCQMPHMDGYEATRRIRRMSGRIAKIPIVALTASTMPGDRERCLDAGMDDYVPKPISRSQLAKVLQECLAKESMKSLPHNRGA